MVRVGSWTAATVKPGGLRDRDRGARSVDADVYTSVLGAGVETVPDAGELQANVSLANADK